MMSMRGLAELSLTTFLKKSAPCSAAVSAPKVWTTGYTSLSMVLGMPMTTTLPPCFSRMYFESSAAWVLVSSPPMVWMTFWSSGSMSKERIIVRQEEAGTGEKKLGEKKDNMTFAPHIDAIFDELLGSYFKGGFALLDEASFYAVFDVGELS
jgi:hypothetical protein